MPIVQSKRVTAAELGELCLGYLTDNPDELMRFMTTTGYDPGALRAAVGTRGLTQGLIEYFANWEPIMLAVCAGNGLKPEDFMRVFHKLNPQG